MTPTEWIALARVAEAVAWPLVALVALGLFRKELIRLLRRIEGGSWGKASLKLREDLEAAERKLDESPTKALLAAPSEEYDQIERHLLEIAKTSPAEAVFEAWAELERTVLQAVSREVSGWRPRPNQMEEAIRQLERAGLLTHQATEAVGILKDARGIALRKPKAIRTEHATDFVRLAMRIASGIHGIMDSGRHAPTS